MNIFYLDKDEELCAQYHNDKHVVKMILEYAQLLSTAHRITDGVLSVGLSKTGRKQTRYVLSDERNDVLYTATHANHPSAKWARHNATNYRWLYSLLNNLCKEYTHRYGKLHTVETKLLSALAKAPNGLEVGEFSPPWRAMPDDVKIGEDSMASYRNYYIKYKKNMSRWTNREMPDWFAEGIYKEYGDVCSILNDHKRQRIISMPLNQNANLQLSR